MQVSPHGGRFKSKQDLAAAIRRAIGGHDSASLTINGTYARATKVDGVWNTVWTYGDWLLDLLSDIDGAIWLDSDILLYSPFDDDDDGEYNSADEESPEDDLERQGKGFFEDVLDFFGVLKTSSRTLRAGDSTRDGSVRVKIRARKTKLALYSSIGSKIYEMRVRRSGELVERNADYMSIRNEYFYTLAFSDANKVPVWAFTRNKTKSRTKRLSQREVSVLVVAHLGAPTAWQECYDSLRDGLRDVGRGEFGDAVEDFSELDFSTCPGLALPDAGLVLPNGVCAFMTIEKNEHFITGEI